jgi:hypothetical protein
LPCQVLLSISTILFLNINSQLSPLFISTYLTGLSNNMSTSWYFCGVRPAANTASSNFLTEAVAMTTFAVSLLRVVELSLKIKYFFCTQGCVQPDWGYFVWTKQIILINPYKLIQTFFVMILKNIYFFSK